VKVVPFPDVLVVKASFHQRRKTQRARLLAAFSFLSLFLGCQIWREIVPRFADLYFVER